MRPSDSTSRVSAGALPSGSRSRSPRFRMSSAHPSASSSHVLTLPGGLQSDLRLSSGAAVCSSRRPDGEGQSADMNRGIRLGGRNDGGTGSNSDIGCCALDRFVHIGMIQQGTAVSYPTFHTSLELPAAPHSLLLCSVHLVCLMS